MTVYNWMCLLGIPGLFAGLIGFIRLQIKANEAMRLGVQAMLRDRLLQGYKHYLEKDGPILTTDPIWKTSGNSIMPWEATGI